MESMLLCRGIRGSPKAKAWRGCHRGKSCQMSFNQQSDRVANGLEDQPQVFRVRKARNSLGPLLTWEYDRETPKCECWGGGRGG